MRFVDHLIKKSKDNFIELNRARDHSSLIKILIFLKINEERKLLRTM